MLTFKCIVRLRFFVSFLVCLDVLCAYQKHCVFTKKDILKYLCLNYSHVSSCSFYERESCCVCAFTHIHTYVNQCIRVCSMFSDKNKMQWEWPNVLDKKRWYINAINHTSEKTVCLSHLTNTSVSTGILAKWAIVCVCVTL